MQDPKAKLARANEHINLFEIESRPFTTSNSYTITYKFNNEEGKHIWQFDSPTPNIPLRLSTIAGDALFNFRSALDHLVWQLVLANGYRPGRHNSFPIYHIPSEFKTKSESSLRGVSQRARTLIEGLQPRPGRNWELLYLPSLNNFDKHRALNLCVISIEQVTIQLRSSLPREARTVHLGRVQNGTILCTISSRDMDVKYEPTFQIAFAEAHNVDTPILILLHSMADAIQNIFNQLEPEAMVSSPS